MCILGVWGCLLLKYPQNEEENLTKISVADGGCDVLLTALSQAQDTELQHSRLASQTLSMPPGHLSPSGTRTHPVVT